MQPIGKSVTKQAG